MLRFMTCGRAEADACPYPPADLMRPMTHVYFDHNATTPVDERVLAAMLPYLRNQYGNASSRHEFGTQARKAVEHARLRSQMCSRCRSCS